MNSSPTAFSLPASSVQILTTDDPQDDTQKTPSSSVSVNSSDPADSIIRACELKHQNEEAARQQGSLFFQGRIVPTEL
jgi:hypothetical protein